MSLGLRLRLAEDCVSSAAFHEFSHHWSRFVARAAKFVNSSLWRDLFFPGVLHPLQPTSWPVYDHLLRVLHILEDESNRVVHAENASRLNAWRFSCRRLVCDAWPLGVASVKCPQTGPVSMDPTEIEKVLWELWRPVFCPSPEQAPVLSGTGLASMSFVLLWSFLLQLVPVYGPLSCACATIVLVVPTAGMLMK